VPSNNPSKFSYQEWINSFQLKWPWEYTNNYVEHLNEINNRFNLPSLNQIGNFFLYNKLTPPFFKIYNKNFYFYIF
jgi:hypothetical protein